MPDLFAKCACYDEPDKYQAMGLYPYFIPIQKVVANRAIIDGRELIMVGSNNYLGLSQNETILKAAQKGLLEYGSSTCGSRFLNGTLTIHEQLEKRLSQFMGFDGALAFSTGFQTNLGVLPALVNAEDIIIADQYVHASIIDACMLSGARVVRFRHNSAQHLEKRIKAVLPENKAIIVVVDGVYSMEGDLAALDLIVPIVKKHGLRIFVDDAHGIGVLGARGRGTVEHFGMLDQVDIIMGTFSKSFASLGGFVVSNSHVIKYIKHCSRPFIFSASVAPANVAAVLAALDIIDAQPWRRQRLMEISQEMIRRFKSMGFDVGNTATPVIPVIIGANDKTFMMWRKLMDYGVFTNPIISPAVPPNRTLIRTSYTATITDEELDIVSSAFEKAGKELHII